ncbi:hypothetical protein Dimus_036177, partial [Dionaea muscipula]
MMVKMASVDVLLDLSETAAGRWRWQSVVSFSAMPGCVRFSVGVERTRERVMKVVVSRRWSASEMIVVGKKPAVRSFVSVVLGRAK